MRPLCSSDLRLCDSLNYSRTHCIINSTTRTVQAEYRASGSAGQVLQPELAAPRILVCSGKGRASGWKGSFRLLRSTAPPKPVTAVPPTQKAATCTGGGACLALRARSRAALIAALPSSLVGLWLICPKGQRRLVGQGRKWCSLIVPSLGAD
jgi:hypothetical protein